MKCPYRIVVILTLAAANSLAAQNGGVTHIDSVPAPSLRRNLVGDPDWREATVYLPPSYSKHPYKRYPVIYLLHGFEADHRAFMKGAYQNLNIRISMDSLIRVGLSKEMIVVTPNARTAYDGSFYADNPVTGNWETFIIRDLIAYIDGKYRTIRTRSGRGIAGHSMGGYGAFRLAMRHPERFAALYMLSPCCLSEHRTLATGPMIKAWKALLGVTDRSQVRSAGFNADLTLSLATVYSPDPANPPLFVRLPYRMQGDSVVLVPEVNELWRRSVPIRTFPQYASNLKRLEIAFDAGRKDGSPEIPMNVASLDSLMTSLGIAHTAELYDGTHGSRIRARLESKVIPFFSKVLH
jgi:S-formylglutathione hydrolase FrmB